MANNMRVPDSMLRKTEQGERLLLRNAQGEIVELPYFMSDARFKKTKEEKSRSKRLYRREYVKRPLIAEKMKKRAEDPEVIARKKAYSERPDVKERKKIRQKEKQAINKLLKYDNEELYHNLLNQVKAK